MKAPDRGHLWALTIAAKRLRVTRYEQVGSKTVKVVYTLVHSNNDSELKKAHERLEKRQQQISEARVNRNKLRIVNSD